MTFELKSLSPEAVSRALEKAERYRLLNEPWEAESICRDILEVDRDNQQALATLLLALTERFDEESPPVDEARRTAERLRDDYARAYFTGLVLERRAKAHLRHSAPGSGPQAYQWLREAMEWYDRAEAIRDPGNDDPLLRWNACARLIMRDRRLVPKHEERVEPIMLE
jgi:hypothetical protein